MTETPRLQLKGMTKIYPSVIANVRGIVRILIGIQEYGCTAREFVPCRRIGLKFQDVIPHQRAYAKILTHRCLPLT